MPSALDLDFLLLDLLWYWTSMGVWLSVLLLWFMAAIIYINCFYCSVEALDVFSGPDVVF